MFYPIKSSFLDLGEISTYWVKLKEKLFLMGKVLLMFYIKVAPTQALGEIFTFKAKSQEKIFTLIGDVLPNRCPISISR